MIYDSENQKQIILKFVREHRGLSIEEAIRFANTELDAIANGEVKKKKSKRGKGDS